MRQSDSPVSKTNSLPDFSREQSLIDKGAVYIAGVDEAGRGPLAGPVVVASVILDPQNIPTGLNDSKKLSAGKREVLFSEIFSSSHIAVVSAPPETIEKLNIRGATLWAMAKAVRGLGTIPCHALIDGQDVPDQLPCPGQAVIGGDANSVSIAAASIVAKIMRDRMCLCMDVDAPGYGFLSHKGYGTARHMTALNTLGASPHHRADFAPVARVLGSTSD